MTAVQAPAGSVRDLVLEARATGERIRIVGGGNWLDAGRPVNATRSIHLATHSGLVEYIPGDLTLTARAGTSLADIARATAAHGQWLAIDPFGSPDGTIGATVATASSGPLAHAFGSPRDQVLGLEIVSGNGDVIRAGGKVVKNVAGFDLTRLFTGSWGTLGIITEVTVRLRALPVAESHVAVTLPDDRPDTIARLVRAAVELRAAPYAMELVNGALASCIGLGPATALLVRLGGNARAVAAQLDALAPLGRVVDAPPDVWTRLRVSEPAGASVLRLADWPAGFADAWNIALESAALVPGAMMHGTLSRGVVRLVLSTSSDDRLRQVLEQLGRSSARITGERLQADGWTALERVSDGAAHRDGSHHVLAGLMRRVKETYDPMHLLNPGILGDEIA